VSGFTSIIYKLEYSLLCEVNANATSNLLAALQSNFPVSYNPTSAITFYFNQGRNELAAANFIVPQATALLIQATGQLSGNFTNQFVQNATDIAALKFTSSNAPSALSDGVGFQLVDLRPFS
jgi:Protein of unknown function (DUF3533)